MFVTNDTKYQKDGYDWKKKLSHSDLRVKGEKRLKCYYAALSGGSGIRRRAYWDKDDPGLVLVHYLSDPKRSTPKSQGGRAMESTPSYSDDEELDHESPHHDATEEPTDDDGETIHAKNTTAQQKHYAAYEVSDVDLELERFRRKDDLLTEGFKQRHGVKRKTSHVAREERVSSIKKVTTNNRRSMSMKLSAVPEQGDFASHGAGEGFVDMRPARQGALAPIEGQQQHVQSSFQRIQSTLPEGGLQTVPFNYSVYESLPGSIETSAVPFMGSSIRVEDAPAPAVIPVPHLQQKYIHSKLALQDSAHIKQPRWMGAEEIISYHEDPQKTLQYIQTMSSDAFSQNPLAREKYGYLWQLHLLFQGQNAFWEGVGEEHALKRYNYRGSMSFPRGSQEFRLAAPHVGGNSLAVAGTVDAIQGTENPQVHGGLQNNQIVAANAQNMEGPSAATMSLMESVPSGDVREMGFALLKLFNDGVGGPAMRWFAAECASRRMNKDDAKMNFDIICEYVRKGKFKDAADWIADFKG